MSHNRYFRSPRTHNEAVHTFDEPSLVRAKRSLRNLPDGWDDIKNGSYRLKKSWKANRKFQSRDFKREKFTIVVENEDSDIIYDSLYEIEQHLERVNYNYTLVWKRGYKSARITYYGQHIGNWSNARYEKC